MCVWGGGVLVDRLVIRVAELGECRESRADLPLLLSTLSTCNTSGNTEMLRALLRLSNSTTWAIHIVVKAHYDSKNETLL